MNPQLIKNARVDIKTSLKTIEPYALKALIKEDLAKHPGAKVSEISSRIPDIDIKEIRKMVYSMVGEDVRTEGARTNRVYFLVDGRK